MQLPLPRRNPNELIPTALVITDLYLTSLQSVLAGMSRYIGTSAFPSLLVGRLPRLTFRGLLTFTLYYSLRTSRPR
jgi:hypothetical protein